jgi:transposase
MSLKPQTIPPVPASTATVARAAFPKGTAVLRLRDELGTIYQDELFAALYPERGQPAAAPWRLALVSVLQFLEDLPDRQAADAVRGRIDWKYALSLDLTDPGFDFSVLSEFRDRLVEGGQETLLLETLLVRLKEAGLVKPGGRQRTDSTHVLAAIRGLNRLETIGETLRAALNSLAEAAPAWLTKRIAPDWFERYGRRVEEYRLPKGEAARTALAERIGRDGHQILAAVYAPGAPTGLHALPAVQALRRTWVHQFYLEDEQVRWRTAAELPPAGQRHDSPYDVEARYGNKRSATWVGYKVHLTETCDAGAPHLITHVETTPAPVSDIDRTAPLHEALAARGLAPAVHFLDAGYVDAPLLLASQAEHGIEMVGPVRPDASWQGKTRQGYDLGGFTIDWEARWEARTVTCPQGRTATCWVPKTDPWGNAVIHVRFPSRACTPCPERAQCTQAKASPRNLTFRPRAEHEALQEARRQQETEEWRQRYATRAGIEGTLAQALQLFDLRHCRYIGPAKTRLQHVLTAVALNIVRLEAWWTGRPLAKTRISRFAALQLSTA